jgi:DNA processing protein
MDDKIFYNALAVATQGDYKKIAKLKGECTTWKEAHGTHAACRLPLAVNASSDPEEEWQKLEKFGVRLVLFDDDDYPPLLREIPSPPFGIYILGTLTHRSSPLAPALAIVGTRRATPDGKKTARQFARELAQAGFTIISGLAFGVDAAAHEGCLEADGMTVAILAGGLDEIYPHSNETLAKKIIANGGALISEYPIGQPAYKERFLERNRIVSGFSQGILVIEAPEKSGSLVTARYAFEQNRDVFVVPGPITHPNFKASHELIRQGAELVTKPEHIMESYGVTQANKMLAIETSATSEEKLILEALRSVAEPAEVDKLANMTKLEPQIVNQAITFLIIKNLIKEVTEGYIMN